MKEQSQLYHILIKDGIYEKIEIQPGPKLGVSPIRLEKLESQKVIDLEGRGVLPSFVDIHTHLDKAFSLASVPNQSGTLQEAIQNYSDKAPSFTGEIIKERVKRAAFQSLSFGTTFIRTHVNFEMDVSRDLALSHLQAVLEAKIELSPWMTIQVIPMFSNLSTRSKQEMELVAEAISYGVDGIGGAPHLSLQAKDDIEVLFQLAVKNGKPLDLHVDEQDNPAICTIEEVIRETKRNDYQGNVITGHLCSLAAMDESKALMIMEQMAKEKIGAVTLPGANLYLQGRGDKGKVRRGITRVKELMENGVEVATASDNVNDPFHPFGRGDLLQIGLLTAYAAHLASEADLYNVLHMMTDIPGGFFGFDDYGITEKSPASFVIVDNPDIYGLFAGLSPARYVFNQGRWVSATNTEMQIFGAREEWHV